MKEKGLAIIAAAGVGKRFGGKKQYARLGDRTILERVVAIFRETGFFQKIVIVLLPPPIEGGGILEVPFPLREEDEIQFVAGGQTRAESVFNGFRYLNVADDSIILIHDAVRPLVSKDLVSRGITALDGNDAVVPILPVSDTVKRLQGGRVVETIDRKGLGLAQTPQVFRASVLRAAYDKSGPSFDWTDEAMLVEKMGGRVMSVVGEKRNIKITTPEDLRFAEFFLSECSRGL